MSRPTARRVGLPFRKNTNDGVLVYEHALTGQGGRVTAPIMSDLHAGVTIASPRLIHAERESLTAVLLTMMLARGRRWYRLYSVYETWQSSEHDSNFGVISASWPMSIVVIKRRFLSCSVNRSYIRVLANSVVFNKSADH